MRYVRFLMLLAALFALSVTMGCHGSNEYTDTSGDDTDADGESGGGGDVTEEFSLSSAEASSMGRGVTIAFSEAVPSASVSAKATVPSRAEIEAELVISDAGEIIAPTRMAWAEDGSSLAVWGKFPYCAELSFSLGTSSISFTMPQNPLDFLVDDGCTADIAFVHYDDSSDSSYLVAIDGGDSLGLGNVNASSLFAGAGWVSQGVDLSAKAFYAVIESVRADGGAVYSAVLEEDPDDDEHDTFYLWDDYAGTSDYDAKVVVDTPSGVKSAIPRDVGDVDGDGVHDIAFYLRESQLADTTTAYLGIVSGAGGLAGDLLLGDVADYELAVPDPAVAGEMWSYVGPRPLGDINGDGYADLRFMKIGGKLESYAVATSEVHIFSGADLVQGVADSAAWRLLNDQTFGYFSDAVGADVNCDGTKDLVLSSWHGVYDDVTMQYYAMEPRVFIFFGGAEFPSLAAASDADVVLKSQSEDLFDPTSNPQFGLDTIGDANADGCEDVLVSIRSNAGPVGAALMAGSEVWAPEDNLIESHSIALFAIPQPPGDVRIGAMRNGLSRIGDIDNDGLDDLALGCTNDAGESVIAIFRAANLSGTLGYDNASSIINEAN